MQNNEKKGLLMQRVLIYRLITIFMLFLFTSQLSFSQNFLDRISNSYDYELLLDAAQELSFAEIPQLLPGESQPEISKSQYKLLSLAAIYNLDPLVRRAAVRIISTEPNKDTASTLVQVLVRDNESIVKAEAAYSLGDIGINDQFVINGLSKAIREMITKNPDNGLATAIIVSIEQIGKKNGGIQDQTLFSYLIRLASSNYFRQVRNRALKVLEDMSNYE